MVKIVVLGGGTGLSVILRGLKKVSDSITAVVTVSDDGGGSGVLREDLGMLPPGDIRSCILALSNKEPELQKLLQYRFKEGRLSGQCFGNLMIAAMLGISDSFEEAIKKISDIFKITGEVLPVSSSAGVLTARLKNGVIVRGESNIPLVSITKNSGIDAIWMEESIYASQTVIDRIMAADAIILGPGSLYTSVISTLLTEGICESIAASKAKLFYISNIMTQPGETDHYCPADHLEAIYNHTGIKNIDHVLINNKILGSDITHKYLLEGANQSLIKDSGEKLKAISPSTEIVEGDFVEETSGYAIHAADKIAKEIITRIEIVY